MKNPPTGTATCELKFLKLITEDNKNVDGQTKAYQRVPLSGLSICMFSNHTRWPLFLVVMVITVSA